MIALLAALGLAALAATEPWSADSVSPRLSVAPGLGVALGDAAVVDSGRGLAVAPARPAAEGSRDGAADVAVAPGEGTSRPQLGIAPARAVARIGHGHPIGGPPPAPAPQAAPPPQPPAVPVATPVAGPTPPPSPETASAPPSGAVGGESPGPITSGGGPVGEGTAYVVQVCEGDEYTLFLAPAEGREGGEAPVPVAPHDLNVYFAELGEGAAFYLVLFDGEAVEIGDEPVLVEPGRSCAQIDLGVLLGESVEVGAEIRIEAARLDEALEPALP